MKKILYAITFICFALHATTYTQSNIIQLSNSGDSLLTLDAHDETCHVRPGREIQFYNTGSFAFKQDGYRYCVTCPQNIQHALAHLDSTTIAWLAGNVKQLYPNGLDQIEIKNDTLYTIVVRYILSKIRSQPRVLEPEEETSKVVGDETGQEKTGSLQITDAHNNTFTITFPRHAHTRSGNADSWSAVKLCANTIALFHNGFMVKRK